MYVRKYSFGNYIAYAYECMNVFSVLFDSVSRRKICMIKNNETNDYKKNDIAK